jgi:transcriptional regulator of met regulon
LKGLCYGKDCGGQAQKKSKKNKKQQMFTTSQFALKAMNAICGEGTRPNPMALKKTMEKHMLMLATIEGLTSNRKIKKRNPRKHRKAHIPQEKQMPL